MRIHAQLNLWNKSYRVWYTCLWNCRADAVCTYSGWYGATDWNQPVSSYGNSWNINIWTENKWYRDISIFPAGKTYLNMYPADKIEQQWGIKMFISFVASNVNFWDYWWRTWPSQWLLLVSQWWIAEQSSGTDVCLYPLVNFILGGEQVEVMCYCIEKSKVISVFN